MIGLAVLGWVAFGAALVAARLSRQPQPEFRDRLVEWAVRGARRPLPKGARLLGRRER